MAAQLRLGLKHTAALSRETFIVSDGNAGAFNAVESWPAWPGRTLALVGPAGCGKSHLAAIWAENAGAAIVAGDATDVSAFEGRPVLLENADSPGHDDVLFHLINMAGQPGGGLLVTARTAPSEWPVALPDLRSRLNALTVAPMGAFDDTVLRGVLQKLFRERMIRPSDDLLDYLVRRIERSAAQARAVVARLDEAAAAENRPVSRVLAARVLDFAPDDDDLLQ